VSDQEKKEMGEDTQDDTLLMPLDEPENLDSLLPTQSVKDIKKKKRKRIIIIISIITVIALIAGAWFVLNNLANRNANVEEPTIMEVGRSDFNKTINETGALRPISSTLVAAPVSGTIEELYVTEGDRVEKGANLFLLRNPELDEAVYSAQDARNSAGAAVTSARNSAQAMQVQLDGARATLADAKAAYPFITDAEQQVAAKEQIDQLESGILEMSSGVTQAWAQADEANAGVNTADRALAKAVEMRDQKLVTAPVSGVIVGLNVSRGSVVVAGSNVPTGADSADAGSSQTSVLEIADMSAMMIRTAISENDIATVAKDQNVRITLEALPDVELSGKVVRIAPQAKKQDSLNPMGDGSNSVKYDVDVRIDELDPRLRIGMTGEVIIEVVALTDVIVIPLDAIMYEGTETYVTVRKDDETVEHRAIKTGASNDTEVVVTDGLEVGERIEIGSTIPAPADKNPVSNVVGG
jgi:macrolide-specific efflux system membrane fusion protein